MTLFDITTALVAERQQTLREEAHHHRLGRVARRTRSRRGTPRAAVVPAVSPDVAATPPPAAVTTSDTNPQERTAA